MADLRVSRAARQDILAIGRYTQRRWGAAQRRRYLDGLERRFERLVLTPTLAAERSEFDPPVRIHRYGAHLVIYRTMREGGLVVRVLHETMDVAGRL